MKKLYLTIVCAVCSMALLADNCESFERQLLTTELDCEVVNEIGDYAEWYWNPEYGAMMNGYSRYQESMRNEDWLITPAFNLSGMKRVTLTFDHAIKYATLMEEYQTLWVSNSYVSGTPVHDAAWQKLTIPIYPDGNNWTFAKGVEVEIPEECFQDNTVFAFKYTSPSDAAATWEIRNLVVRATCDGEDVKVSTPTPLPEIGNGNLIICGNNLENYYYYYDESSRPKYHDEAGFIEKTRKIVNTMLMIGADIYSFCEVEAREIVLSQLADSLNKAIGENQYAAVADGINQVTDSYDNAIKSGFIYRTDKVKPVGNNNAASTAQYYRNTMRIQVFEELATGERFTLSMNHFKAKDNSADSGNATRMTNVNNLLSAINSYATDRDILILGDLNCTIDEEPLQKLQNAGYIEQLLYYDSDAASYCYGSTYQLIDHAFANASMAKQITGAGVFHINTFSSVCNEYDYSLTSKYRYSDHDPYLISLRLGKEDVSGDKDEPAEPKEDGIEDIYVPSDAAQKILYDGQIYILVGDKVFNVYGQQIK